MLEIIGHEIPFLWAIVPVTLGCFFITGMSVVAVSIAIDLLRDVPSLRNIAISLVLFLLSLLPIYIMVTLPEIWLISLFLGLGTIGAIPAAIIAAKKLLSMVKSPTKNEALALTEINDSDQSTEQFESDALITRKFKRKALQYLPVIAVPAFYLTFLAKDFGYDTLKLIAIFVAVIFTLLWVFVLLADTIENDSTIDEDRLKAKRKAPTLITRKFRRNALICISGIAVPSLYLTFQAKDFGHDPLQLITFVVAVFSSTIWWFVFNADTFEDDSTREEDRLEVQRKIRQALIANQNRIEKRAIRAEREALLNSQQESQIKDRHQSAKTSSSYVLPGFAKTLIIVFCTLALYLFLLKITTSVFPSIWTWPTWVKLIGHMVLLGAIANIADKLGLNDHDVMKVVVMNASHPFLTIIDCY